MSLLLILCLMNLWALHDCLRYVKVSRTGALLTFRTPNLLDQIWEVSPAEFGYKKDSREQLINGKVEGFIFFLSRDIYHDNCTTESVGIHPYTQHIKQHISSDVIEWILIIDRYNCSFLNKVSVAQKLNASAAIICASESENGSSMTAPAHLTDNIIIPSILLSRPKCEILMHAIGVENWDPSNPESILYPVANNTNYVFAVIEWGLLWWDDLFGILLMPSSGIWMPFLILYLQHKTDEFIERAEKCVATVQKYYHHSDKTDSSIAVEFITNKSSEPNRFRIFQKTETISMPGDMQLGIINIMYDPYNPLSNIVYDPKYPPRRKAYCCMFYVYLFISIFMTAIFSYFCIPLLLLSFGYILEPFYIYSYFIGYQIVGNLIIFFAFRLLIIFVGFHHHTPIEPTRVATKQEILMFEQHKFEIYVPSEVV